MPRAYGIVLSALLVSSPAFAGSPTAAKLQAFKDAKAKVAGDIDTFIQEVKDCNPPLGLSQIVDGFANLQNPQSAKSLLNSREVEVVQHVAAPDSGIAIMEKSAVGCADNKPLLNKANAIAAKAVANLQADSEDLKRGADTVSAERGKIEGALDGRKFFFPAGGNVAQCDAAKRQLDVMAASTKTMLARLGDLAKSFADRVSFLDVKVSAPGACASASAIHTVSFEPEDIVPQDPPQEGDSTTAI